MTQNISFEFDGMEPDEAAEKIREFGDVLPNHLERAVTTATMLIMRTAKQLVNVDTGRLQSDIGQEVERIGDGIIRGIVGTNVHYAVHQEYINPYLRPAINEHRDEIEDLFRRALEDAHSEVF